MKFRLTALMVALMVWPILTLAATAQEEKSLADAAREARKRKEEAKKDQSVKASDKKVVTTDEMKSAEAAPETRKRVITDENIESVGEGTTPMERYTDLVNGFSIRLPAQCRAAAAAAKPDAYSRGGFEFVGDAGGGMLVWGKYVRNEDLDTKGGATAETRHAFREFIRGEIGGSIVSEHDRTIRGMSTLVITTEGPPGPSQLRGITAVVANEDHRGFVFICMAPKPAFERVEAQCRSVLDSIRLQ